MYGSLARGFSLLVLSALLAASAAAATFTVTNTNDAGAGTFRQALTDANAAAGTDTVAFNIPAATDPNCVVATGVCTIAPTSALPDVTGTTVIDGYTQPGAAPNTNPANLGTNAALKIEINLAGTAGPSQGLNLGASGSTVRGLVLNRSPVWIITLGGTGGHVVEGNFIGTNATGTAAFGVLADGVVPQSANNLIGGTSPAARNLISGNGPSILMFNVVGTIIQGNLIGTNAAGTAAIPNDSAPSLNQAQNTLIGGPTAGARNVISGNTVGITDSSDFFPSANNNLIQGNYIGVDVTGTAALGNGMFGVGLSGRGTILGGSTAGAGNVIAASYPQGNVVIGGRNNVVQGNRIGTNAAGTSVPAGFIPGAIAVPGVAIFGNSGTLNNMVGGTAAGAGNIVAFNTREGVSVSTLAQGQSILGNSIFSNTTLGINEHGGSEDSNGVTVNSIGELDGIQNYPVLTSISVVSGNATISGTLNSSASTTFRVEFFSSPVCDPSGFGEGQTFLGMTSVTTDATGNAAFGPLVLAVPGGQGVITSTATNPTGDTSEFSACPAALPGSTTTALVSSSNPSTIGASVTFSATVNGASATGTVQFRDGAANLGAPVALPGSGIAQLTTSALTLGTHPITAVYSGDVNNATSTSANLDQVVNPLPAGSTSIGVASSLNPSTFGQSVTFTATVAGASPTGTVQFFDGAAALGPAGLNGAGVATLATSALAVGAHSMTAVYLGDANNTGSTSPVLVQRVNAFVPPPGGFSNARAIPTLSDIALVLLIIAVGLLGWMRTRRHS